MKTQNTNMLFGPGFDTELRTYQLLALEQRAVVKMYEQEIFPSLHELIQWNEAIKSFLDSKQVFENSLTPSIEELDPEKGNITYAKPHLNSSEILDAMYEWALTAIQKTNKLMEEFEGLKKELLHKIESSPVGILPLYRDEGYLLITHGNDTDVFRYHRKVLFETNASLREISSDYFSTYEVSAVNTPQNIKLNLIKECSEIPNPATWSFVARHELPLNGTLLPLAKEKLNGMIDK